MRSTGGKPIQVMCNLGLAESKALKKSPYLLYIGFMIESPDSAGMPQIPELRLLQEIEDSLAAEFENRRQYCFAGRTTQNALRSYYFYLPDTAQTELHLIKVMRHFKDTHYRFRIQSDKSHYHYFNLLYPTELEAEAIVNRRILAREKKKAVNPNQPGAFRFSFLFNKEKQRKCFLEMARKEGYDILANDFNITNKEHPYKIILAKAILPNPEALAPHTLLLHKKAAECGGIMENWSLNER